MCGAVERFRAVNELICVKEKNEKAENKKRKRMEETMDNAPQGAENN